MSISIATMVSNMLQLDIRYVATATAVVGRWNSYFLFTYSVSGGGVVGGYVHVSAGAHRSQKEHVRSLGAGVTDICESLDMCSGNQTLGFCKSIVIGFLLL